MTTDSASARSTDTLAFQQAAMRLALEWSAHLSASEVTLVLWLLANTLGRGRAKGNYTLDQMVNGQQKVGTDKMWMQGTGLSRPTAHRTTQSLIAKGVITATRTGRVKGLDLSVNLYWRPTTATEQETNVVTFPGSPNRRPPKKPSLVHQIMSETDSDDVEFSPERDQIDNTGVIKTITQSDQIDHATTGRNNSLRNNGVSAAPSARAASLRPVADDPREAAKQVIAARSAAQQSKPSAGKVTTLMLEQDWRRSYRDAFPAVQPVAWSAKEHHMTRSVMKKFDPAAFRDFLQWLVLNWSHAVAIHLGWMKVRPAAPEIGFVVRWHRELMQAYLDREQAKWRGTLDKAEQKIQEHIARGLSREAALLEVAKEATILDTMKIREQADDALRLAKRMQQTAEKRVQQAYAEKGRRAQATPKVDFSKGTFDPDKGVVLEDLPPFDPEKF